MIFRWPVTGFAMLSFMAAELLRGRFVKRVRRDHQLGRRQPCVVKGFLSSSSTAPLGNEWNTDQHDVVDVHLVNASVAEAFLNWAHRVTEVIHVAFFEPSIGERALLVNAFEEGVDLDGG